MGRRVEPRALTDGVVGTEHNLLSRWINMGGEIGWPQSPSQGGKTINSAQPTVTPSVGEICKRAANQHGSKWESECAAKIHSTHAASQDMESNKIFGAHLVSGSHERDRFWRIVARSEWATLLPLARRARRRPAKNAVAALPPPRALDTFVPKTAGVVFAIKSQQTHFCCST